MVLMFDVALNSDEEIVCLDDPEMSLHIGIQLGLVERLVENSNKTFIVATHSPQIVNNWYDNTYDLARIIEEWDTDL